MYTWKPWPRKNEAHPGFPSGLVSQIWHMVKCRHLLTNHIINVPARFGNHHE